MGKLYLVRHAHAGSRGHASGPDHARELDERGWRQAQGISDELASRKITRLISSPFRRCVQTLEPLAGKLGLEVEVDDRLAERATAADALALAAEVRGTGAVLCSHGDVIPDVLEHLLANGTQLEGELRWPTASTWIFTWDGQRLAKGRYVGPPA